nr:hypothetical protein CFP56_11086 [Quercus suber]
MVFAYEVLRKIAGVSPQYAVGSAIPVLGHECTQTKDVLSGTRTFKQDMRRFDSNSQRERFRPFRLISRSNQDLASVRASSRTRHSGDRDNLFTTSHTAGFCIVPQAGSYLYMSRVQRVSVYTIQCLCERRETIFIPEIATCNQ